jgi:hypothetical protein
MSFALWQVCMSTILSNQSVRNALMAKLINTTDTDWEMMDERALLAIQEGVDLYVDVRRQKGRT